jgi:hypothetical protein
LPLHILFAGDKNTQVSSALSTLTHRLRQFGCELVFEREQNELIPKANQFSGLPIESLIGGPITGDLDIPSAAVVLSEWLAENIENYRIMVRQGGQVKSITDLSSASLAQGIETCVNAPDAQLIIEKI